MNVVSHVGTKPILTFKSVFMIWVNQGKEAKFPSLDPCIETLLSETKPSVQTWLEVKVEVSSEEVDPGTTESGLSPLQ